MTLTDVTVVPFAPAAAPPGQRLAVGQLIADTFASAYPDDPPLNAGKQALELGQQLPEERTAHFVVWDDPEGQGLPELGSSSLDSQALAWGSLNYDTQQNLHLAHARLIVHPHHRRQGLGRALAQALNAAARRQGRRTVTFVTSDRHPGGEAFAHRLGAEAALPMRQSRLALAGVDRERVERWQRRPADDPHRLHTWDAAVPEEYLERVADLMMVMNTAPRGGLDMDDWRITPQMVRAWEANAAESGEHRPLLVVEDTRSGELMGYTDVSWRPERAAIVYQSATAVRPAVRGQGLGKWLKAAMLDHIAQRCPGAQVIQTNNAEQNAAMLGINEALGFRPWVAITEWQLRLK
ncbi:GNAT family N-acetyltransferase [Deinococcus aerolatus]|uniref:GNAT family N-acetyltransferase n=1 Tax=Deinococcus aerolatus TaxID=522487 RepID=A0ABQ2FYI5_9DEIO|nr:GNAT family N-acetyltransferase [Deinococcus aerolatus]GGL66444.1 GNAT family N-acetyltransferase [Deinococcus aerolatus]